MFEFLEYIAKFLAEGIYTFFVEATAYLIEGALISYVKFQLWALQFSYDVASVALDSLQISQKISQSLAVLPSDIQSGINFFRVPESLNIIISALTTRYVMSFIPGAR